ncbi:MAG TPA: hypothetical protein VG838_03430 [Opitutaceae bacterium]|nr:hypothetical protein [Opitutaceae bacterium]
MPVIPLTLSISLCLVFTFVVFFLREHAARRTGGMEHASLLPLAEEIPRPVPSKAETDSGESPATGGCGCRRPGASPCAGCLARPDPS